MKKFINLVVATVEIYEKLHAHPEYSTMKTNRK